MGAEQETFETCHWATYTSSCAGDREDVHRAGGSFRGEQSWGRSLLWKIWTRNAYVENRRNRLKRKTMKYKAAYQLGIIAAARKLKMTPIVMAHGCLVTSESTGTYLQYIPIPFNVPQTGEEEKSHKWDPCCLGNWIKPSPERLRRGHLLCLVEQTLSGLWQRTTQPGIPAATHTCELYTSLHVWQGFTGHNTQMTNAHTPIHIHTHTYTAHD